MRLDLDPELYLLFFPHEMMRSCNTQIKLRAYRYRYLISQGHELTSAPVLFHMRLFLYEAKKLEPYKNVDFLNFSLKNYSSIR
jgi:hypothetical protein